MGAVNFTFHFIHSQKISAETAKPKSVKVVSSRPSQKSILAGIVRKRKASPSPDEPNEQQKKTVPNRPTNDYGSNAKPTEIANEADTTNPSAHPNEEEKNAPSNVSPAKAPILVSDLSAYDEGALKCIGILPGIGKYRESSDSEKSTDTDDEYDFCEFDWMGRRIKKDGDDGGCH